MCFASPSTSLTVMSLNFRGCSDLIAVRIQFEYDPDDYQKLSEKKLN